MTTTSTPKFLQFLLLPFFVFFLNVGWGQVAQFNFPASNSLVVSTNDANVTVSNVSLSAGTIETNITTGAYFPNEPYIEETGGWTATSQASAKNFLFTITAGSGYTFSITNVSFRAYATAAGPSAFGFRIGSTDIYSVNAPDGSIVAVNQSVSSQTGLTTATIKIQGWLNGSRTSAGTGVFRLDDIVISGTVTAIAATPTISSSGTLSALSTTYGTPSSSTSFNVSGTNLTADLVATAPTGFEVSSDGTTYGSTATFTQTSGSASGTLSIRLAATAAVTGSYNSQNITLTSTNATTVNITTAASGNTVSAKGLTITGLNGSNKTYDGLTAASTTGTAAYSGLVNGESFSVTGNPSASFVTAAVGTGKTITVIGYTAPSTNYSISQPTGLTADITAKPLTLTANSITKTEGATLTGGAGSTAFTSSGLVVGESIGSVTITYGTGASASDAAGTYVGQVTPSLATGGTFSASNYSITYVNGNIIVEAAPASPTITVSGTLSALSTTYGTPSSTTSFTVSGAAMTSGITIAPPTGFEVATTSDFSSTIGTTSSPLLIGSAGTIANTTIYVRIRAVASVAGSPYSGNISLTSAGASNQSVATSSSTVNTKTVTITGVSGVSKIYDGTTTASLTGTASYVGLANGESFSVTGTPTAEFSNKTVGTAKTVTITGYDAPSSNYTLTQPSATADITALSLTVTGATVSSKTYDGTTSATITGSTLIGVISPDVVTVSTTGTFASANAGIGVAVTSTQTLGEADAGNYTLIQPTGLSGTINAKALIITANDVTKESGQLLTGSSSSTAFTSSGLVSPETIAFVTIAYGSAGGATGDGAILGTYANQVTPSSASGGTFNASNYVITYVQGAIIVSGFTPGNLVVERIGDGATALTGAAAALSLLEISTSGTTNQTISTLFTGTNLLTESGSGTSGGYLNSYNGFLGVSGYNSNLATASVSSLNTKATNILGTGASIINRVVFPTSGSPLPFTANSFRSIIPTSATTFYASGAGSSSTGGIWYYNGISYTQISTAITNTRNVEIFNGNLYFSTGSGTQGVYQVGTGTPTSSGQTATLIAASASPYGFSISPDGNTIYIADDGLISGNTGGGIQKWTKSGGAWTRQYTFGTQSRGITVDYSGANPIIYATTVTSLDNNKIIKITDTGSSAASSDVISAGSNYVFRGVDFAPAAAPSAPTIGTVTQTTCSTSTGSVELTGLPSGQWRIYGFPSGGAVGTGSSTTITGLSAGSYTFVVTSSSGRTSELSASVTINAQPSTPSAPTASNGSICGFGSLTLYASSTGATTDWYDSSTGGTALLLANNVFVTPSLTTSTTYYVEARNTTTGCVSATRTAVTATVNTIPTVTATASQTVCAGTSVTLVGSGATTYSWTGGITDNTSFTANSTQTYTVTGTTNGCSSTASSTVTVNPTPVVTNMTASICSGSSFSVTPVNGTNDVVPNNTTYSWNAPTTANLQGLAGGTSQSAISGTVFNTTNAGISTTYTVTPTATAGSCVGATFTVAVTVNALPVVTATTPAPVCAGTGVTLNGQGASTYVWNNGVTNGVAFTPTATAYYSVTGTDANGCTNSGGVFVTVNPSPTALSITGPQCLPSNTALATITSTTSVVGVSYQLRITDGTEDLPVANVAPINGTGSALIWNSIPQSNSSYYVLGTSANGCTSSSEGVTVLYNPANGNTAYTYYADADGDGSFSMIPTTGCSYPTTYSSTVGLDCNDNNSAIKPGAIEVCGDGIDNNCDGADAYAAWYRSANTGDWSTASTWENSCDNSNWSLATIAPTADNYSTASPYLITVQADHIVTVSTTSTTNFAKAGSLTINATGSVVVNGKLTVVNALVNNGTLTINNGGSFVQNNTTDANSGSGTYTVNMSLTGSNNGTAATGRYWFIGSPMNNTPASTFYDPLKFQRLWQYNASANSWPSVITTSTNSSSLLVPGIGYLYRGGANTSFTYSGGTSNFNNNITTSLLPVTVAGGYLPVTGYNTTGYKFVSNPYPSHVDWNSVTRTNLNVNYWIRTADNTNYESYNATSGLSVNNISGQTSRYIPPMQGFFVYAYGTNSSLVIDNTDRVHSGNVLHSPVYNQVVRLKLNDGKTNDEALVYENENASNGIEEYDTYKMFDLQHHQLYFMEGTQELTMDGLKDATAKQKVDMGIQITSAGTYTINATELGIEEDVMLEDKFTHTFQDLKRNSTYSFTTNAGTYNNRFVLHFTLNPQTETAIETETVGVTETEGETDGVSVYITTGQQVKVWVTNTAEFQNATVKVYDAIGNLIERKNMTSNELLLDLNTATGVYLVEVVGTDKTFTKKVFVTK